MEKDSFLELIREQFEETSPQDISLVTIFKNLEEYDSMVALCIIAAVDQAYSIKIGGDEIRGSSTIEDLFQIVSSKL